MIADHATLMQFFTRAESWGSDKTGQNIARVPMRTLYLRQSTAAEEDMSERIEGKRHIMNALL
jgi:hypothetical protein